MTLITLLIPTKVLRKTWIMIHFVDKSFIDFTDKSSVDFSDESFVDFADLLCVDNTTMVKTKLTLQETCLL